jgi:hypothetical protein
VKEKEMICEGWLCQKKSVAIRIIEFLHWGSGYVYNRKGFIFGLGLIIVAGFEHAPLLFLGLDILLTFPYASYVIGHILISTLFAYDAYKEALAD